ncbi:MAG: pyrroline-5-carboxylate reductase [Pseudomonadota bacterium]
MNILMVGCGNMGGALLKHWADVLAADFTVVDPHTSFSHPKIAVLHSADPLADQMFDMIVVAIKPQLIDQIMPEHAKRLRDGGAVLSIAAGFSAARLSNALNGAPVIRVMPNMPAAIGKGVSGIFFTEGVSNASREMAHDLMTATGEVVEVDAEDSLDKVTAIAGSGPGYVFELARAYVEAARSLGFNAEQSRTLVLGTLSGAVEMAIQSGEDLAALRNAVTSKAGTTEAGLEALNGAGLLTRLFEETTTAAYQRAVELR